MAKYGSGTKNVFISQISPQHLLGQMNLALEKRSWRSEHNKQFRVPSDSHHSHSEPGRVQRKHGTAEKIAICFSYMLFAILFPMSLIPCLKVVNEFERAVILRLGIIRKGQARGPGMLLILPCVDIYYNMDMRIMSFGVPPQEVLTRDSVTVSVDAVVYYKIKNPVDAVTKVENYSASTHLLAATTLRNVIGSHDLMQLLSDRDVISRMMKTHLDEATDPWGVQVERVEIKDVRLPLQLQRAMAAEAEAGREAKAKIIAAEGEIKASQALKEASNIMTDNPMALQLRYLQSLNTVASTNNSTIVFPFPMEILSQFSGSKR